MDPLIKHKHVTTIDFAIFFMVFILVFRLSIKESSYEKYGKRSQDYSP